MMLRTGSKGFTLLEVLFILIILSILLGLSLPQLRKTTENATFKDFTRKAYLFLDYVKVRAALKSKPLTVVFDEEGGSFLVESQVGPVSDEEDFSGPQEDRKGKELLFPPELTFVSEQEKVLFFPDGTIQEFEVVIRDDHNRIETLWSKGFDGVIRVGEKE